MWRQLRPALVSTLVWMVFLGLAFPLAITGIAQAVLPFQANGGLIRRDGHVVGAHAIGQAFAAPRYFHPRPSAGGYDAANSGGTNEGPTSARLVRELTALAATYRAENGLAPNAELPADAITRSASGLDPEISPANAGLQVARVARARGLPEATVRDLVARHTAGRQLGVLGEPRVNVLALNLALDAVGGRGDVQSASSPLRAGARTGLARPGTLP